MRTTLRKATLAVAGMATLALVGVLTPPAVAAAGTVALPSVAPGARLLTPIDPGLRYEGRWDRQSDEATTVNGGARIFLRFGGSAVFGHFDTAGITVAPEIYAIVDGARGESITVDQERILLTPSSLTAGEHTLELVARFIPGSADRWNAPLQSGLHLTGFELPSGSKVLTTVPAPAVRFTFLGDSITQGTNVYCAESVDGSDCTDATADYAWLVAGAFGAGLEQVGFSSQGITKGGDGNVPPAPDTLNWNFSGSAAQPWDAQLVVVNLGTNDMLNPYGVCLLPPSTSCTPDITDFQSAYTAYLQAVRSRYPDADILAMAPLGVSGEVDLEATAVSGAVSATGDPRTHFVDTRGWLTPTDYTEQIHPNAGGHQKIAAQLINVIEQDTPLRP